jgi:hypothetical protein
MATTLSVVRVKRDRAYPVISDLEGVFRITFRIPKLRGY